MWRAERRISPVSSLYLLMYYRLLLEDLCKWRFRQETGRERGRTYRKMSTLSQRRDESCTCLRMLHPFNLWWSSFSSLQMFLFTHFNDSFKLLYRPITLHLGLHEWERKFHVVYTIMYTSLFLDHLAWLHQPGTCSDGSVGLSCGWWQQELQHPNSTETHKNRRSGDLVRNCESAHLSSLSTQDDREL